MISVTGIASFKPSSFSLRLEKFIDDVRKGRGTLGSTVPYELGAKVNEATNTLVTSNPSALTLSNAYSTALSYDKKARFLSSVSDTAQSLSKITRKA